MEVVTPKNAKYCTLCRQTYLAKEHHGHMHSMIHHKELAKVVGRTSSPCHECLACHTIKMDMSLYALHISTSEHAFKLKKLEMTGKPIDYFERLGIEIIALIRSRNKKFKNLKRNQKKKMKLKTDKKSPEHQEKTPTPDNNNPPLTQPSASAHNRNTSIDSDIAAGAIWDTSQYYNSYSCGEFTSDQLPDTGAITFGASQTQTTVPPKLNSSQRTSNSTTGPSTLASSSKCQDRAANSTQDTDISILLRGVRRALGVMEPCRAECQARTQWQNEESRTHSISREGIGHSNKTSFTPSKEILKKDSTMSKSGKLPISINKSMGQTAEKNPGDSISTPHGPTATRMQILLEQLGLGDGTHFPVTRNAVVLKDPEQAWDGTGTVANTLKRRADGGINTEPIAKKKKKKKKSKKSQDKVGELISVSLREEELSKSVQDLDISVIEACNALQLVYHEVQRLLLLKQRYFAEVSSLRAKRIEILQGLQGGHSCDVTVPTSHVVQERPPVVQSAGPPSASPPNSHTSSPFTAPAQSPTPTSHSPPTPLPQKPTEEPEPHLASEAPISSVAMPTPLTSVLPNLGTASASVTLPTTPNVPKAEPSDSNTQSSSSEPAAQHFDQDLEVSRSDQGKMDVNVRKMEVSVAMEEDQPLMSHFTTESEESNDSMFSDGVLPTGESIFDTMLSDAVLPTGEGNLDTISDGAVCVGKESNLDTVISDGNVSAGKDSNLDTMLSGVLPTGESNLATIISDGDVSAGKESNLDTMFSEVLPLGESNLDTMISRVFLPLGESNLDTMISDGNVSAGKESNLDTMISGVLPTGESNLATMISDEAVVTGKESNLDTMISDGVLPTGESNLDTMLSDGVLPTEESNLDTMFSDGKAPISAVEMHQEEPLTACEPHEVESGLEVMEHVPETSSEVIDLEEFDNEETPTEVCEDSESQDDCDSTQTVMMEDKAGRN